MGGRRWGFDPVTELSGSDRTIKGSGGNRRRIITTIAPSTVTHTDVWPCLHFYPSSSPSCAYFSYTSCWDSEGPLAISGQCDFDFRNNQLTNLPVTFACSNLSGPFFFFTPLSIPGYVLYRMFRKIPYLHPGNSWTLRTKYEGMGVKTNDARGSF